MLETKVTFKRSLVQTRHSHRPIHWMGSPLSNPLDGSNVSIIITGQRILDTGLPFLSMTFVGAGGNAL